MRLDVIIPTYNRQSLLERTLRSVFVAPVPIGMQVKITVVDNKSSDNTVGVVQKWQKKFGDRLSYIFEEKQGRSYALNTGIAATNGHLVGFIDDDEEIDLRWYECINEVFSTTKLDFIGGPYVPNWEIPPPSWLPRQYCGVIGWINGGDKILPYNDRYPGILMGGNAVFSRAILGKVGGYRTCVGRNSKRLLSGEDEDMYRRLLEANAKGLYVPDLKILHYIPAARLTKTYHRKWCFWRGASYAVLDGIRREPVCYLFGVPRYLYGKAARGLIQNLKILSRSTPAQRFANELAAWELIGFLYGKHFFRRVLEMQSTG
jgi:glucosyl-dolichyl phosphate glucuronosyltransferase